MALRDTIIGVTGAAVLVAAMAGIFYFERAEAPAAEAVDSASIPDLTATEIPVALGGCDFVEAWIDVAPGDLREHVPADFEIAVGPAGMATVYIGGMSCEEAKVENETGATTLAWTGAAVVPKADALKDEGVQLYVYRLEHFLTKGAYGMLHDRLGLNHTHIDAVEASAAPTGSHLYVKAEGWQHHVAAPASPPGPLKALDGYRYREYGPAPGGYAYTDVVFKPGLYGGFAPGAWETGEGTLAREALGASGESLVLFTSGMAGDARVGFVPHAH